MIDFAHLHMHTEYSLLDGTGHINQLVEKAKECGHKACAITDHGFMYGVIEFYTACKAAGIKPIIGVEIYTAPQSVFSRTSEDIKSGHLVLLAKNNTGYHNLVKLCSLAATDGFYYHPRCDMSMLKTFHEGIIALSACLSGDINKAFLANDDAKAEAIALEMKEIFGEDFYIELQYHGLTNQKRVLPKLIALAKKLDIKTVATNDIHYLNKDDAFAQHVMSCIQQKRDVDDPAAYGYGNPSEWYYKSTEEMEAIFGKVAPEALENTGKIADMCNVEIEMGKYHLPSFPTPPHMKDNKTFLKLLAHAGLKKRYRGEAASHEEQLNYELSVIEKMGYVDYFLIVSDFINFAKRNRIPVGPGRGSAAGSMVAYCIGITEVEPTQYKLLFERFLNPERVTMPDIDVDFDVPDGRTAVMAYVAEKYGTDHVAQIVTFQTLAARGVIDDVGKVLKTKASDIDRIKSYIPKKDATLAGTLKANLSFKKEYDSKDNIRLLVDTALKLEGCKRNASIHAAGLIISPEPVSDFIPISRGKALNVSQFNMGAVEETGMLKVDFLGLKTLTVLQRAEDEVNRGKEELELDLRQISLDDKDIYRMLSRGETTGVFQLESGGMREVLQKLKPTCFEDLVAVIALYRPGPMDSIPKFIAYKHDPSKITYAHPLLKPILEDTYGQIVYQEQVMSIVRDLAGYSYGRSDLVRRMMAKKKADKMDKERETFIRGHANQDGAIDIPGCLRNGISSEVAESLWDEMKRFAEYAFNRAHAAAYAIITYQTAFMRNYYPLEFQSALMTNALGKKNGTNKLLVFINDCRNRGIEVFPPDINKSLSTFSVEGNGIRFGLLAIKNTGKAILAELTAERETNGPYKDLQDVIERCQTASNKQSMEALIMSGACDGFEQNRAQMLAVLPSMMSKATAARKKALQSQISMEDEFFTGRDDTLPSFHFERVGYPDVPDFTMKEKLTMEQESTGMYISGHPLDAYKDAIKGKISHNLCQLALPVDNAVEDDEENDEENYGEETSKVVQMPEVADGTRVRVAGAVGQVKEITTKKKQQMCMMTIEDTTGKVEATVFPRAYEAYGAFLKPGAIVLLFGKVDTSEYGRKVIVDSIDFLDGSDKQPNQDAETKANA